MDFRSILILLLRSTFSSFSLSCKCYCCFAIRLENSVLNLPDGQVKFFEEFKLQKNCEINLLIKMLLGLVEMMFGLVNVSFSLPEWQAVKMTFFAPCKTHSLILYPCFFSTNLIMFLQSRVNLTDFLWA